MLKIRKLPTESEILIPIEELYPSSYSLIRTGCAYPFVIHNAIKIKKLEKGLLLPSLSKSPYLGDIIHKLLDECIKGLIKNEDEYENKWKAYVKSEEKIIKELYPELRSFGISDYDKMYESCDTAMQFVPSQHIPYVLDSGKRTIEVKTSIPGLLTGRIDRIKRKDDGVEIIDFKSGNIHEEDGSIKESIVYQLNLYAISYEMEFGHKVRKLTILKTSDCSEVDVPILTDEFDNILNEIKEIHTSVNEKIVNNNTSDLQVLDERHCHYCDCRHMCAKYLKSDFRSPSIVDGKVDESSNQRYLSLVDSNGEIFTVSKLEEFIGTEVNNLVGKHLILVNVSQKVENNYKRTNNTLIYEATK